MDERRSRLSVVVAVAILAVPLTYVLAVGPLNWLLDHGYMQDGSTLVSVLRAIYTPLEVVSGACPPIEPALEWYLKLWE